MNMIDQCFVEGVKEIIQTLESQGNNCGVPSEYVATIMQHQRLYNDTLDSIENDIHSHKFLSTFQVMSFELILRTLRLMKTPQLVDFQPVTDPLETVSTHRMKTILPDADHMSLKEMVAVIAQQLAMEIDQHVLSELRSRVGSIGYVDPTYYHGSDFDKEFDERYTQLSNCISYRTGSSPNWIVASSDVSEYLIDASESFVPTGDEEPALLGVRYLGELNWRGNSYQKLYENTFASEDELLMGCKPKKANAFQFKPKVLIQVLPSRKPNQKVKRARLQTQFETEWPDNGGNFYARINVATP